MGGARAKIGGTGGEGAGQGKSKDIRMWHPFHDSDRERGKERPGKSNKRLRQRITRPRKGNKRDRKRKYRSLSLLFSLPSSRPPDFLSFPLCLSISSEPIPLVPPLCAALIRGIYNIIIKSRHTASNSHEVFTRFSCRQKCLLRIYLFITFCCNHMFLPLACSFMLGRLTYSSPNKY